MQVTLLSHTPLSNAVIGARTCYDSFDKSDTTNLYIGTDNLGDKDVILLDRLVNRYHHESIIEHVVYTFKIEGISRACLQQLARHRIASLSVESTRYVLKRLLKSGSANELCVKTGNPDIDWINQTTIEKIQELADTNQNDVTKYALPECLKTNLVWTINARSLKNFLQLRLSPSAMPEIRQLALAVYHNLPEQHKFLYRNEYELTWNRG